MSVKVEQDAPVIRLACSSLFHNWFICGMSIYPLVENIVYKVICLKKSNP